MEKHHVAANGLPLGINDSLALGALTAEDTSTVDTTYGAEEAAVIANLRTRVGELEAVLVAAGILTA